MALAVAPPLVLSIAGFDPTAGAGVSADVKTLAANNCYGVACITALTVQNSTETRAVRATPPEFLQEQLEFLLKDVRPKAIKIGMLANRATVELVTRCLEAAAVPWVVLDPIWQATSGLRLIDDAGWESLRERLCPRVTVLTPNLPEAERLAGRPITKLADMEAAAVALHQLGPKYVIITGGHLEKPIDLLYDGERLQSFATDRVRTPNTHGSGCTFSAALAANLAHGKQVADAVLLAKAYVTAALRQSYPIGSGPGPLNHLYRLQEPLASRNVDPAPQVEYTTR